MMMPPKPAMAGAAISTNAAVPPKPKAMAPPPVASFSVKTTADYAEGNKKNAPKRPDILNM